MIVRHNIVGLKTLNQINKTMKKNAESAARLSSGMSINKAADDAAGLSISEGMRAQIHGLYQAERNGEDARMMMNIIDGALQEETELLQRMRELTVQSLNDTLTAEDRDVLQTEFRQLQISLDRFPKAAEWGSMPVIEAHQPSFVQLEGNHYFQSPIQIVDGYNSDLEITIDGTVKKLSIPEGVYSVGEIADLLDDRLMEIDPNLIVNVTDKGAISLQAENNKSIDSIKGGASFLFYEYTLGNPPGMVIGVTKFENYKIRIVSGQSDTLSFFAGSDKQYTLKFRAGEYSLDEVIDEVNRQLEENGEKDVQAIKYGDDRIALTSNRYVITGLSGNMIEIDGITSILYDNSKSGSISKSRAQVYGYADLSAGVKMQNGVNDELRIFIDQKTQPITVSFLQDDETEKTLSGRDIASRINDEFKMMGIDAVAEVDSRSRLWIKSNYFGSNSRVVIDKQSPSFKGLFVNEKVDYVLFDPVNGTETAAQVTGRFGIKGTTVIDSTNNTLNMKIDGETVSVVLEEKAYTKEELAAELNRQLGPKQVSVSLSPTTDSNQQSALIFSHEVKGSGGFWIDPSSSAAATLLNGTAVIDPLITNGKTTVVNPPEGIVRPPEYTYYAAKAEGITSLQQGITLNDDNNGMSFTMNGEEIEIALQKGAYANAQEFLNANRSLFDAKGVVASLTSDGRFVIETKEKGSGQQLSGFGGTSHEFIMGKKQVSPPYSYSGTGTVTTSTITGKYVLPATNIVDESNSKMDFTFNHLGVAYDITLSIAQGNYSDSDLITALNQTLKEQLLTKGLSGDEITAAKLYEGTIRLSAKDAGSQHTFGSFTGGFFRDFFQKKITVTEPYASSNGYTGQQETYIVGREGLLDKDFVINPNVNDSLMLDFYHNGVKRTLELSLEAGHYNSASLIAELNRSLESELSRQGLYPDLVRAQMGGVTSGTAENDSDKLVFKVQTKEDGRNDSGSYRIDGVRGSAAYTFFYRAEGEPKPTYTIGVVDLSGTTEIKQGVNDTFIFEVDGFEKKLVLSEGSYGSEDLLEEINRQLQSSNANVIASYFEGKLKLSSKEVGQIPIDGIRGNARGTLFFQTDERENQDPMKFQIGANAGDQITFERVVVSGEILRVNTLMIHDPQHANKALKRLDSAIQYVSSQRSYVGAITNRLEHAINNARNYAENLIASESKIRDTDMAKKMTEKVKTDILLQASQAILAQSNTQAERVVELLR